MNELRLTAVTPSYERLRTGGDEEAGVSET